ncbi:RDD family protein [Herbaspirillum lusitanum]|uniref:RDD family protein n=1 Tax=Herbaspirillum lusitanum TaxID=213312 RepID=UPI0003009903
MSSASTSATATPSALPTPSLRRRLCSMVYESMLLFGVVFISTWIFSTVLEQRHALYLRHALESWLFVILGLYFIWFWSHGGQTLAMKTWRIRLAGKDGAPVKAWRALLRFLLSWLWFLPGLALAWALGAKGWMLIWIPAVNVVVWAALIYTDPQRQFLHDRLAGTRIVDLNPSKKKQ